MVTIRQILSVKSIVYLQLTKLATANRLGVNIRVTKFFLPGQREWSKHFVIHFNHRAKFDCMFRVAVASHQWERG